MPGPWTKHGRKERKSIQAEPITKIKHRSPSTKHPVLPRMGAVPKVGVCDAACEANPHIPMLLATHWIEKVARADDIPILPSCAGVSTQERTTSTSCALCVNHTPVPRQVAMAVYSATSRCTSADEGIHQQLGNPRA